jgi:hypothetical protein
MLPIHRFVTEKTLASGLDEYGSQLLQRIAGTVAIMLYEWSSGLTGASSV